MRIWRPETFQGTLRKKKYFEGWYFKSVSADGRSACAVIPGISLSAGDAHAFVQFFDSRAGRAHYFRFPAEDFKTDARPFRVRIGASSFSLAGLHLDLRADDTVIHGDLEFSGIRSWPVKFLSPGAMGWFRFVPRMECYHGVLSFDHGIKGSVTVNDERTDFSGGRGYAEKDWGVSMPSSWIWMQTNHFREAGVSLFGSIARIPWFGASFTGFIVGVLVRGNIYRFATYTGARLRKIEVTDRRIIVLLEDGKHTLEIDAVRKEGVDLPAPREGRMTARVNESLQSTVSVHLAQKSTGQTIFSGTGGNAGLEFVGRVEEMAARLH